MKCLKEHFSTLVIANRSAVWEGEERLGSIREHYSEIIDCINKNGRIYWHNDDMIPLVATAKNIALIEKTILSYGVN